MSKIDISQTKIRLPKDIKWFGQLLSSSAACWGLAQLWPATIMT